MRISATLCLLLGAASTISAVPVGGKASTTTSTTSSSTTTTDGSSNSMDWVGNIIGSQPSIYSIPVPAPVSSKTTSTTTTAGTITTVAKAKDTAAPVSSKPPPGTPSRIPDDKLQVTKPKEQASSVASSTTSSSSSSTSSSTTSTTLAAQGMPTPVGLPTSSPKASPSTTTSTSSSITSSTTTSTSTKSEQQGKSQSTPQAARITPTSESNAASSSATSLDKPDKQSPLSTISSTTKSSDSGPSIAPLPTTTQGPSRQKSSVSGDGTADHTGSQTTDKIVSGTITTVSIDVSSTAEHKTPSTPVTSNDPAKATASFDPKWKVNRHGIRTGKPHLSQQKTNGKSKLGSLKADRFQQYRGQQNWGDVRDQHKCPWQGRTISNTNPYKDPAPEGKPRTYDWTISRHKLAPDGVEREMILVNGEFPGPTIEANWGDTIEVTVRNNMTDEGTSVHWHGFLQKNSASEDGVPGITQCPIAPGQTFTYKFKADLYGTSWWHAHYSGQYSAGLYGAMIIHGPTQDNYDYDADLGPLLLADYYRDEYYNIVKGVVGTDPTKLIPKSDNNLINGKGVVNCSAKALSDTGKNATDGKPCVENAGLTRFNITSGKKYRLRLINSGAEGLQKFSIDNHNLTVVSYDFVPIKPYTLKTVTLGIGQRADVILEANNKNSSGIFWIRSTLSKCSFTNQPNGLGILYYENANKTGVPAKDTESKDSIINVDDTNPCENDDLRTAVPVLKLTPPAKPDSVQPVVIDFGKNTTGNTPGHYVWRLNNSTFHVNYNKPILRELVRGVNSDTFPDDWNTYDFKTSKSIQIVLINKTPAYHPMHIHGHNMYVLSSTNATTTPKDGKAIFVNPDNPTRRDVQILPPNGQIVIQIDADNPGVWPLHCHIAWHVSGGLYMNVIEETKEIAKFNHWPDKHEDNCKKWDAWTNKNRVGQIDSGLKRKARRYQRDDTMDWGRNTMF